MNIREALMAGDPVRREGPLADADVQMMRATTLASGAGAGPAASRVSVLRVALAAYCVIAAALTTLVVRRADERALTVADSPAPRGAVSRVYFETASGIRVVWTFDAGLSEMSAAMLACATASAAQDVPPATAPAPAPGFVRQAVPARAPVPPRASLRAISLTLVAADMQSETISDDVPPAARKALD